MATHVSNFVLLHYIVVEIITFSFQYRYSCINARVCAMYHMCYTHAHTHTHAPHTRTPHTHTDYLKYLPDDAEDRPATESKIIHHHYIIPSFQHKQDMNTIHILASRTDKHLFTYFFLRREIFTIFGVRYRTIKCSIQTFHHDPSFPPSGRKRYWKSSRPSQVPHTVTLTHSHTHTLKPTNTHTHTHPHSTHTHSHTHSLTLTLTPIPALTLTPTHSHSHSHSHSLTLTPHPYPHSHHTHTHTHTHAHTTPTLTLTHTHTHTHTYTSSQRHLVSFPRLQTVPTTESKNW